MVVDAHPGRVGRKSLLLEDEELCLSAVGKYQAFGPGASVTPFQTEGDLQALGGFGKEDPSDLY